MNTRVAVWSLSGTQSDTWRIHSSLVLPEDHAVTTLDCNAGKVLALYSDAQYLFKYRFIGRWKFARVIHLHTHPGERLADVVAEVDAYVRLPVINSCLISESPSHRVTTPSRARFCPSMMYIATTSIVRLFSSPHLPTR